MWKHFATIRKKNFVKSQKIAIILELYETNVVTTIFSYIIKYAIILVAVSFVIKEACVNYNRVIHI